MNEPWDESGGPYFLNYYYVDEKTTSDEIINELKGKWWRKMSEYKTLDQIFPNGKGDGRKFIFKVGASDSGFWFIPYFRTGAGRWHGLNEMNQLFTANESTLVKEYIPPKKMTKVTMYKPIFKIGSHYENNTFWSSNKSHWQRYEVAAWMTYDFEVEE